MITQLSNRISFQNKWIQVHTDQVQFPSGKQGEYNYVERSDGAVVLVVDRQQQVLLVKQYRYPIHEEQWGLPGGAIGKNEDVLEAAKRELREETGLVVTEIHEVAAYYCLSSLSSEKDYLLFATVNDTSLLGTTKQQEDESFTKLQFVPLVQALGMIDRGEITDVFTCNAIQLFARNQ